MNNQLMYRQGDILFLKMEEGEIPDTAEGGRKLSVSKNGIVALGETTGHKHRVVGPAKVYISEQDRGEFIDVTTDTKAKGGKDAIAKVVHEEHAEIELAPGKYKVVHQKEWAGKESREVID